MARPGSFRVDIAKFVEKAGDRADLVVRELALDLFTKVKFKTPVDTGRLRAAWGVGVNVLPKGGNEAGMALQTAKAGDTIYIANNVEYAVYVEFGTSKMAPRAMVRTTVDEFQAAVSRAAAEAKKERP